MTTANNHADRAHSIYSPSAYSRWSRCPGSAKLTADVPRTDTDASLRGTWLHEQTEAILRGEQAGPATDSRWSSRPNMMAVMQAVDVMRNLIDENTVLLDPIVSYEEKVTLESYGYPEVFGTSDASIYNEEDRHLYVIDYKFGHGIIQPEGNGQLMIYAAGRFAEIEQSGITEAPLEITLMIIQPADVAKPVKKHTISAATLLRWMNTDCAVSIEAAMEDDADVNPGEEQCKWCPIAGDCPAQKQEAIDALEPFIDIDKGEVTDPNAELADLLPKLKFIENWIGSVRDRALAKMKDGEKVDGYKLVRSVTKRRWDDPEKAEKWLAARKIPKDQRVKTSVISISEAEALLKDILKENPRLKTNFNKLIDKPEGKIVMALADDSREEIVVDVPTVDDLLEI